MIRPIVNASFSYIRPQIITKPPSFKGADEDDDSPMLEVLKGLSPDELFGALRMFSDAVIYDKTPYEYLPRDITVKSAQKAVQGAISRGSIDKDKIKSICDFGCGEGGGATAIKEIFNPDFMVAVDIKDVWKESDKSIFKECNGLDYLASGVDKFDLVTACMLTPKVRPFDLLDAAHLSLNEGGKVLIFSDSVTTYRMETWLNTHGAEFDEFHVDDHGFKTIVVDKAEIEKTFT